MVSLGPDLHFSHHAKIVSEAKTVASEMRTRYEAVRSTCFSCLLAAAKFELTDMNMTAKV